MSLKNQDSERKWEPAPSSVCATPIVLHNAEDTTAGLTPNGMELMALGVSPAGSCSLYAMI